MNGLTVITPPAASPVNVVQIKAHLRLVDDGGEDVLLQSLIDAAVSHVERSTGRAMVTRGLKFQLWGFPDRRRELALPLPPMIAVSAVKYRDRDGGEHTLATSDYWVDSTNTPGRIVPVACWPETAERPDAVIVEYTAGFGSAAAVPADLVAAVKLIVGHLYENREATSAVDLKVVPMAVETLLLEYARPRL